MVTLSVDGLVSGLGTSDIISQLMQVERQPQLRLQSQKTATDKAITALQGLNTRFATFKSAAEALTSATSWSSLKATVSSADALSVTIGSTAVAGSNTFKVNSLAAAHDIYSADTFAAPTDLISSAGRDITIAYTDATGAAASLVVNNHDGSLAGIAAAINATAGSPITAKVVQTTEAGAYRLQFTSKTTGANSAFTVTGLKNPPSQPSEATFTVATQASDAELLIGSSATPLSIKSATNTITNNGVTYTLKKADPNLAITVDITADGAAMTSKITAFVDAANAILKEIKTLTNYDVATKKTGILGGDGAVRRLASQILTDFSNAVGNVTASSAGIQLTRTGELTLDKTKLEAAYAADPAKIQALFLDPDSSVLGIAERALKTAERASDRVFGVLTTAIEGRRSAIKRMDQGIADWDVRLARKEQMFKRQFAALETALGSSQSQGNWLAGQISGLPSWG